MSRIINCGFIMLDYNACNAWLNLSKVKSQVRYGALDFFYENKAQVTFLFTNNNCTIKRYWYHSRNDKLQTKLTVLSCSWAMSLKWKKKWKRLKLPTIKLSVPRIHFEPSLHFEPGLHFFLQNEDHVPQPFTFKFWWNIKNTKFNHSKH